jgi:hypothetical protein
MYILNFVERLSISCKAYLVTITGVLSFLGSCMARQGNVSKPREVDACDLNILANSLHKGVSGLLQVVDAASIDSERAAGSSAFRNVTA